MNEKEVLSEITPLSEKDCFYIVERTKSEFNYPIHVHPEFELNCIWNAKNAKRIIGDSIQEIDDIEIVLIAGANLEHAWINGNCESKDIREITIQFEEDFLASNLSKNQFRTIKSMFEKAKHGLLFSKQVSENVSDDIIKLSEEKNGFHSLLRLMEIMYELSLDNHVQILSSSAFAKSDEISDSRRVKKVLAYINEHYTNKVSLTDVAQHVNMGEVSFSRFIKKRTGKTFIEYLTDVRVGSASRMLVDTTQTISEICYTCGFNNLSNFNRIFKKKKGYTPKDFRENYVKKKILI